MSKIFRSVPSFCRRRALLVCQTRRAPRPSAFVCSFASAAGIAVPHVPSLLPAPFLLARRAAARPLLPVLPPPPPRHPLQANLETEQRGIQTKNTSSEKVLEKQSNSKRERENLPFCSVRIPLDTNRIAAPMARFVSFPFFFLPIYPNPPPPKSSSSSESPSLKIP